MTSTNGTKLVQSILKRMLDCGCFDRVIDKVRIISAGGGNCVAEMTVEKEHENSVGTLHGGMSATLVDCISTLAIMTKGSGVPGASVNINMTYLKAASQGDEIVINAKTLKSGRTLAFLDVHITNKLTGAIIATGSHTKYIGGS